jgi:uncharacterized protein (TIGR03435 family)
MNRLALIGLFACSSLFAQKLGFEVASVRPTPPGDLGAVAVGLHLDGTQARIGSLPLRDYIAMAYKVKTYQVQGPDSLGDRFDINATLPAGSKADQIGEMLQGLLADRFGLKFHREQKEFQVYSLTRGTRPLALRRNEGAAPTGDSVTIAATGSNQGVSVNLGGGASYTFAGNKFDGKRLDMDTLVDSLAIYMNLPVVNTSGLDGFYDLTLELAQEDYTAMLIRAARANGITLPPQAQRLADSSSTPSLFDAIEKLGLKLETKKLPLDVLVIEQVAKTPTEN